MVLLISRALKRTFCGAFHFGMGLSWHADEPSPAVLHHRGHDHPCTALPISALAEATGHREGAWGLFWLDQRWCGICSLIIIIVLSHVLEIWQPDLMLSSMNHLHKEQISFLSWYEWILTLEGFGIGLKKKEAFLGEVPLQLRWVFRGIEEDYPLFQVGNGTRTSYKFKADKKS